MSDERSNYILGIGPCTESDTDHATTTEVMAHKMAEDILQAHKSEMDEAFMEFVVFGTTRVPLSENYGLESRGEPIEPNAEPTWLEKMTRDMLIHQTMSEDRRAIITEDRPKLQTDGEKVANLIHSCSDIVLEGQSLAFGVDVKKLTNEFLGLFPSPSYVRDLEGFLCVLSYAYINNAPMGSPQVKELMQNMAKSQKPIPTDFSRMEEAFKPQNNEPTKD